MLSAAPRPDDAGLCGICVADGHSAWRAKDVTAEALGKEALTARLEPPEHWRQVRLAFFGKDDGGVTAHSQALTATATSAPASFATTSQSSCAEGGERLPVYAFELDNAGPRAALIIYAVAGKGHRTRLLRLALTRAPDAAALEGELLGALVHAHAALRQRLCAATEARDAAECARAATLASLRAAIRAGRAAEQEDYDLGLALLAAKEARLRDPNLMATPASPAAPGPRRALGSPRRPPSGVEALTYADSGSGSGSSTDSGESTADESGAGAGEFADAAAPLPRRRRARAGP